MPDVLVARESADPAAIVAARDSVRLASIAALQLLPARQRAVLICRKRAPLSSASPATKPSSRSCARNWEVDVQQVFH